MMAFGLFACASIALLALALSALSVSYDRANARAEAARAARLRRLRYPSSAVVVALPARVTTDAADAAEHRKAA